MTQNLNKLLELLLEGGIPFVVVGGFAAVLHGSSQVTRDLDVCCPLSEEIISRLRLILKDLHPVHRMTPQKLSFLEVPEQTGSLKNVYLKTDLGTLDIISVVGGIGTFEDALKHVVTAELFGKKCKILDIDHLIRAKEFMGRPKDWITASELKVIRGRAIKK